MDFYLLIEILSCSQSRNGLNSGLRDFTHSHPLDSIQNQKQSTNAQAPFKKLSQLKIQQLFILLSSKLKANNIPPHSSPIQDTTFLY